MNGQLQEHLQNIDDFIQIDNKIITYKWISKVLKVHTNTAKQLLFAFTQKPEVRNKLLVTYIVAGELEDGEGLCFRLVHEKDLEETKKKFHKITFIHVYSIQKGSAVTGADIYNADSSYKITSEDYKFCSIQPAGEIGRREINVVAAPKTQPTKVPLVKAAASVPKDTKSLTQKGPGPLKTKDVPPDKVENEETSQPPKIASHKKKDKKAVPAKGGNIGALFMKQAAKRKDSATTADVKEVKENVKLEETKSEKPDAVVKTPVNKSGAKKKRKKSKDSKDSTAKRRKRIQVASDSESSNQESDGNERYPSPEPEPETPMAIESEEEDIIPSTPLEKGKKRVRKLVDRVFEDEEGYFITKKEYVVESCSDEEMGEAATKKPEAEIVVDETKPNGKTLDNKAKAEAESVSSKPQTAAKSGGNKPGKPASKVKTNGTSSPKKQTSIMNYLKKK